MKTIEAPETDREAEAVDVSEGSEPAMKAVEPPLTGPVVSRVTGPTGTIGASAQTRGDAPAGREGRVEISIVGNGRPLLDAHGHVPVRPRISLRGPQAQALVMSNGNKGDQAGKGKDDD